MVCLYITHLFDVFLTVHLIICILVINQIDAQNLFYNKFISCHYMKWMTESEKIDNMGDLS